MVSKNDANIPKSYNTDEILEHVRSGAPLPPSQEWVGPSAMDDRAKICSDIQEQYGSMLRFSKECAISQAHLSEFFSGKKQMKRDALLRIFVLLHYSLPTVNRYLLHFRVSGLYVHDRRDYLIADSIHRGSSLQEIDQLLYEQDLETLSPRD